METLPRGLIDCAIFPRCLTAATAVVGVHLPHDAVDFRRRLLLFLVLFYVQVSGGTMFPLYFRLAKPAFCKITRYNTRSRYNTVCKV